MAKLAYSMCSTILLLGRRLKNNYFRFHTFSSKGWKGQKSTKGWNQKERPIFLSKIQLGMVHRGQIGTGSSRGLVPKYVIND